MGRGAGHTVIDEFQPGEVLDRRWRLELRIGHGAVSTVFLGKDLQQGRKVAVKILSGELCRTPHQLARFEREASILAGLAHPNLVAVHAVGRVGASPFIVMKYLPGTTLAEYRRARGDRLPAMEMLRILRQLCAGLGHLHQHGLVHRDVKPGNVIVGPDGHVTILDLGIARDVAGPALTQPGVIVGTPHYMAPEMIVDKAVVDARADLYSLGAVAFELVTGVPPYEGDDDLEVVRAHVTRPVPDAAAVAPEVHPALAKQLCRALAKQPAGRFATAAQMLKAFEAACSAGVQPTLMGDEGPVDADHTLLDEDDPDRTSQD